MSYDLPPPYGYPSWHGQYPYGPIVPYVYPGYSDGTQMAQYGGSQLVIDLDGDETEETHENYVKSENPVKSEMPVKSEHPVKREHVKSEHVKREHPVKSEETERSTKRPRAVKEEMKSPKVRKKAKVPKPVKRADCGALINKFVLRFMDQLFNTQFNALGFPPSVNMRLWADTYVDADGTLHQKTKKMRYIKLSAATLTRFSRILVCMDLLHDMHMANGRTCTQRELFYRAKGFLFPSQRHMNAALQDVMHLFHLSREELGVYAGDRGLISSRHLMFDGIPCDSTPISDVLLRKSMGGAPSICLVVEKETVFAHLVGSGMLDKLPIVIATSKGFPDILTRRFLQWFDITFPTLPVIYLGDFDPHGVLIFLTYLQSLPRLGWIGVQSEDVAYLPERAALPFSTRDDSILASLQRNPMITRHPQYLHEVQAMTQLKAKFEVEAMYGTNHSWVSTLIDKIQRKKWIRSLFQ